ncbi:unnamed protein product [Rhizophagus irregularis]|nr:unnamed protein product [Rhizophagus irregularis]
MISNFTTFQFKKETILEESLDIGKCQKCQQDRPFLQEYYSNEKVFFYCQTCILENEKESLVTQEENKTICEKCKQLTWCSDEWDIFHGFNSYCSILGMECFINDGHHTHQICQQCSNKIQNASKRRIRKLQAQKRKEEEILNCAYNYIWNKCNIRDKRLTILRNKELTKYLRLLDKERLNYRNHCEYCGTLLNSKTENWHLFSYPPPYDYWNLYENILTCKTCFKELAEEYFGNNEDQYQEILDEVIVTEDSYDESTNMDVGWKYNDKEKEEIQQTHTHPDMNPEYLINQPWWTEPIDIQLENHYFDTNALIEDIKMVVQQPLF